MAHQLAWVIPARFRFSSELTADVLQAQVATAGGLLRWLQARAKLASAFWRAAILLSLTTLLIGYIVRRVKKNGVENLDPEGAGPLADAFRNLSSRIRQLTALGDTSGLADYFGCRRSYRSLRRSARECAGLATQFDVVSEQWDSTAPRAARARIHGLREAALTLNEESAVSVQDLHAQIGPSDDATRAQLARTVVFSKQSRDE